MSKDTDSMILDRVVSTCERPICPGPGREPSLWAWRVFGCTVGLLRLIEWPLDGWTWSATCAMWRARYWIDWSGTVS